MKRVYSHIIYTCLTIILLIGCKSDYPYIEYEGNPGKVEFGNIELLIPIMISMNNPLYENHTRGMGGGDHEEDTFYIYAFYTPEGITGVPNSIDYSMTPQEKFHCLVDDPTGHGLKARLSEISSALEWVDTMVYYNNTYPDYRYRFFAYHVDDAVDMEKIQPNRHHDYVSYDIQIDGTQDLMCSCAQPTPEQLAKIKSLASPSNKDFINNLEKLTYSTQSAHRDLIPVFNMEHHLTYIKFKLKADRDDGGYLDSTEYKKIHVRNIIIKDIPYKGEFIVAAEDTNQLGITFSTNHLTNFYIPTRDKDGFLVKGNDKGFLEPLIPDTILQDVGAGFLLPPAKKYALEMDYYIEDEHNKEERIQMFNLIRDKGFEAGNQYEVTINVQGFRKIFLQSDSYMWEAKDSINIDTE